MLTVCSRCARLTWTRPAHWSVMREAGGERRAGTEGVSVIIFLPHEELNESCSRLFLVEGISSVQHEYKWRTKGSAEACESPLSAAVLLLYMPTWLPWIRYQEAFIIESASLLHSYTCRCYYVRLVEHEQIITSVLSDFLYWGLTCK